MNEEYIREVVSRIVADYAKAANTETVPQDVTTVPVEASGKHVHLSVSDLEKLFGKGYELTKVRDLTQPGQFVCKERVTLSGPKGRLENVVVLGPVREHTQVEVSLTDCRALGIDAPVSMSGDLSRAADILIVNGTSAVMAAKSAIVAANHLHMTPDDAKAYGLENGQKISIKVGSARPVVFSDVTVRVSRTAGLSFHIDYDEANACGYRKGDRGIIVGTGTDCLCAAAQKAPPVQQSGCCTPDIFEGRLLQERHIMNLARQGSEEILLQKGTVVTPLAKDLAKSRKIKISYISE